MAAEVRVPVLATPGDSGKVALITLIFQTLLLLLPIVIAGASLILKQPSLWNWVALVTVVLFGLTLMIAATGFGMKWARKE